MADTRLPDPFASVYEQQQDTNQIGADGLYIHAPSRSFGEAISVCLKNYFAFSGRASRSEYWWFMLFTVLAGIAASVIDVILSGPTAVSDGMVNSVVSLALMIPTLAVGWRRLHDTNRSGWWIGGFWLAGIAIGALVAVLSSQESDALVNGLVVLIGLGSLVYFITLLVFLVQKGTAGANRFG